MCWASHVNGYDVLQEDGGGVRVKVENALQADRLRGTMEFKSEFVAEDMSKATLGKVIMEKAWWVAGAAWAMVGASRCSQQSCSAAPIAVVDRSL